MPGRTSQRSETPSVEPTALSRRLMRARERLGVSIRELSQSTGIPAATISAVERGREPRWSTLMRYLETVPGLRAGELLEGPTFKPPVLSATAWEWFARAHGLEADSTQLTLRHDGAGGAELELIVEGLRATSEDVPREDLVGTLIQVACVGSTGFAARLVEPPDATSLECDEGGVRHRFDWTKDPVALRYRRVEFLPAAPSRLLHHHLVATRRVTLALEVPEGETAPEARLLAWAALRELEGDASSVAPYVHAAPHEPRYSREGRRVAVAIDHALPDVTHALAWGDAESSPPPAFPTGGRPETFAPIATALRERSGMSRRELARAMDLSHVTLREAESGRDPRAGTLERYLRALPDAAPQWLLPARETGGSLTLDEAWEWQRELIGIEADRVAMTHSPREGATGERVVRLEGLHGLEPRGGDTSLILSRTRALFGTGSRRVEAIETSLSEEDESGVRTRRLAAPPGSAAYQLLIPGRLAQRAFHLTERATGLKLGMASRSELRERYGEGETILRGLKLTLAVPARELAIRVDFSAPFDVDELWALAYLDSHPPRPFRQGGLLSRVHAGRYRVVTSIERRTAELVVERPLCGVSYGFAWALHLGDPWGEPRSRFGPAVRESAGR